MRMENQHRIQQHGVPGNPDDLSFDGCCGSNNDHPPSPAKYMSSFLTLVPVNVTSLGNGVFAHGIKVKIWRQDHPGQRVGPKPNDASLLSEKRRTTERGRLCGQGHRSWSDVPSGLGMPRAAAATRRRRRGLEQVLPESLPKKPTLPRP